MGKSRLILDCALHFQRVLPVVDAGLNDRSIFLFFHRLQFTLKSDITLSGILYTACEFYIDLRFSIVGAEII